MFPIPSFQGLYNVSLKRFAELWPLNDLARCLQSLQLNRVIDKPIDSDVFVRFAGYSETKSNSCDRRMKCLGRPDQAVYRDY